MGSGISTKYENTYFYRLKEEDSAIAEEEKQYEEKVTDPHAIDSQNDEKVIKFCEEMVNRKPYEESSYSQNLANTAQHFEMNEQGLFGSKGVGSKVRIIKADNPMDSAMQFYREISEGGQTSYLGNRHGILSQLGDGMNVFFRPYPKTLGSPAVEIKFCIGNLLQKIHFIQR